MSRIVRNQKNIQKSQIEIKKTSSYGEGDLAYYCNEALPNNYIYKGSAQNFPFRDIEFYNNSCFYFTDSMVAYTLSSSGSDGLSNGVSLIIDKDTQMQNGAVRNLRNGPLNLIIKGDVDFGTSNIAAEAIRFGGIASKVYGTLVFYSYKGGNIMSSIPSTKIGTTSPKSGSTLTLKYSKAFEEKVKAYGASLSQNLTITYRELTAEEEAKLEKQVDACLALPD